MSTNSANQDSDLERFIASWQQGSNDAAPPAHSNTTQTREPAADPSVPVSSQGPAEASLSRPLQPASSQSPHDRHAESRDSAGAPSVPEPARYLSESVDTSPNTITRSHQGAATASASRLLQPAPMELQQNQHVGEKEPAASASTPPPTTSEGSARSLEAHTPQEAPPVKSKQETNQQPQESAASLSSSSRILKLRSKRTKKEPTPSTSTPQQAPLSSETPSSTAPRDRQAPAKSSASRILQDALPRTAQDRGVGENSPGVSTPASRPTQTPTRPRERIPPVTPAHEAPRRPQESAASLSSASRLSKVGSSPEQRPNGSIPAASASSPQPRPSTLAKPMVRTLPVGSPRTSGSAQDSSRWAASSSSSRPRQPGPIPRRSPAEAGVTANPQSRPIAQARSAPSTLQPARASEQRQPPASRPVQRIEPPAVPAHQTRDSGPRTNAPPARVNAQAGPSPRRNEWPFENAEPQRRSRGPPPATRERRPRPPAAARGPTPPWPFNVPERRIPAHNQTPHGHQQRLQPTPQDFPMAVLEDLVGGFLGIDGEIATITPLRPGRSAGPGAPGRSRASRGDWPF